MSADVIDMASVSQAEQVVAFNAREFAALSGVGSDAMAIYFCLRWWMDYATGLVGAKRTISREMIRTHLEEEIERGKGRQLVKPLSLDQVDRRLKRLIARGLLVRRGGDLIVFLMPLASIKNVRPFQTRDNAATLDAPILANGGGGLEGIPAMGKSSNPRHIRVKGLLSTLQSTSSESEFSRLPVDNSDDDAVVDEVDQMRQSKTPSATWLRELAKAEIDTNGNTAPVLSWIESGRGLSQLKLAIAKAKAARVKAGSSVPVSLGYLNAIIMGMHPAKAPKSKALSEKPDWRSNSATIREQARALGMSEKLDPKTGKPETLVVFADRIAAQLAEVNDGQV